MPRGVEILHGRSVRRIAAGAVVLLFALNGCTDSDKPQSSGDLSVMSYEKPDSATQNYLSGGERHQKLQALIDEYGQRALATCKDPAINCTLHKTDEKDSDKRFMSVQVNGYKIDVFGRGNDGNDLETIDGISINATNENVTSRAGEAVGVDVRNNEMVLATSTTVATQETITRLRNNAYYYPNGGASELFTYSFEANDNPSADNVPVQQNLANAQSIDLSAVTGLHRLFEQAGI